jgi:hypothetical protein
MPAFTFGGQIVGARALRLLPHILAAAPAHTCHRAMHA